LELAALEVEAAVEEDSAITDWKIEMEVMERMFDATEAVCEGGD
jgi:hypothetical protein